ncbi:MAG: tape measure protein [Bacteroidales bacterium]|nr:tape measure protein [Bacteroidales bacterium]
MSGLYFKSGIDKGFEKDLARMSQQINQFDKQLGSLSSTINNTFAAVGIGFGLNELAQFGKEVANITGQFQQLSVAFETMLQSKDKADVLMKQAVELASTTPFSLLDVGQGAKQLLAYGFGADQITETLTKLGNVASGLSIPLNDIVYLYGSTLTQGRLYGKDLLQFTTRGIPMVEELAKQFGVSKERVSELVTEGKVGFPEVEKAINSMTGETGKFFNLMQKQSQTITGRISNMGDEWDKAYNRLGEANDEFINGVIDAGAYLAKNLEDVIFIVKTLIAAVGVYKASVLIANGAISNSFKAMNAVAKANPIGLIATALTIAIPLLIKYTSKTKELTTEQLAFNEALKTTKILLEDFNKIQDFQQIKGTMSQSELTDQKNRIEQQIKSEQELVTKLKVEASKLLTNDKKLAELRAKIKNDETNEIEKAYQAGIRNQIKLREKEIIENQDLLYKGSKNRIEELKSYLSNVDSLLKTAKTNLSDEELEEIRKAANEKLDLENQIRINNITEQANLTNKSDKELKKELLNNELWYLSEKKKITDNELEKAQLKGREIDINFELKKLELSDSDMIEALDKTYQIELEKLKQSYKDKKNEQRKFNKESLKLEKANLEDKMKYIQDEETKLKYDNRISEINELIAIEEKSIEQGQQKRLDLIKEANAEILQLEKELQSDISKDRYEELKKSIDIYKKLLEDLGYVPIKAEQSKSVTDTIYGISSAFDGMGDGLGQALQMITNNMLDIVDTFTSKTATTGEKVTSIVGLIVQAMKMIWEAAVSNWDENAQEIDATNNKIAKTIAFEAQINKILRERIELQREYSAFLDANYKDVYQDAIQQVKDSTKTINETIGQLQSGLTLGATGTGKSLFGLNETSKEFSFTVDEIINGAGETKKKWTRALSGIFDPLDLFGTGANAKAYNDAFEQVKVGFNVALSSMGKTASDTANFSTEEWTTFYTLLDEGGFIIDEGTKALVTAMRESQQAYTEALEAMRGVIQDIAGELGNTLGDSIVDSITNGTDAMYEFGKSVNDVLLQLAKAEMNELFFRGLFDNLQAEMNASMEGGDMNWQDDILRFYDKLPSAVGNAQTFLEGFDEQMKALGFEGVTSRGGESEMSRAGQVQQAITEDTASEFVGRLGAIMLSNQAIDNKTNDLVYYSIQNLVYQKQIAENTSFLPAIEENTRRMNEKL